MGRAAIVPPRVVLHVGTTGTGGPSLRDLLDARRDELLRHGVLLLPSVLAPEGAGDPEEASGPPTPICDLAARGVEALRAALASDGAGAETLLLSVEDALHDGDADRLRPLRLLLDGRHLTLIATLGRQSDWLRSRYVEAVRDGRRAECRSIDRFARDMLASGKLDHAAALDRLIEILAPDEVRVLDLDALDRDDRLLAGFCAAAGLPIDGRTLDGAPSRALPRAHPEAIEAHRRLNVVAAGLGRDDRGAWSAAMRALAGRRGEATSGPGALPQPRRETRRALVEALEASNRALSRGHLDGAAFGIPPDWPEEPAPPMDEALTGALFDEGLSLLLEVRRRAGPTRGLDEGPCALPSPLDLAEDEIRLLDGETRRAGVMLAYGAKAASVLASLRPGLHGVVVLDDRDERTALQRRFDRLDLPSPPVVHAVPAGARPSAYPLSIWSEPFFRHPDLIVIDGPLRPACLVAACLGIERPTRVLFHGYAEDPANARVERLATPDRRVGRIAVFDLQPGSHPGWALDFLAELCVLPAKDRHPPSG